MYRVYEGLAWKTDGITHYNIHTHLFMFICEHDVVATPFGEPMILIRLLVRAYPNQTIFF
jgi:hypothetical protein